MKEIISYLPLLILLVSLIILLGARKLNKDTLKNSELLNNELEERDLLQMKKSMNKTIQIVSPSLKGGEKYPAINHYPYGRTIGYMNIGDETFYIQIICTSQFDGLSEGFSIIPIIELDDETITRIKSQMGKSIIEVYYLDKPKSIAIYESFDFNEGIKQHVMQISLSGK